MENETVIRLGFFIGLFLLFAGLETVFPRRTRVQKRVSRWFANWSLTVINSVALRLVAVAIAMPLLAVGAAINAADQGIGLFNWLGWNVWVEGILVILMLDLAIWLQHLITHKVPILWRLHRVHHADRDMDVTTGIRFHPVEIALSMLVKIGVVYALGPAAWAVIVFEVILNGTALFNHANIELTPRLDALVRKVLVTPDMHRIHHSTKRYEHDSNYGFSISLWDRLFRTYIGEPEDGQSDMKVGLQWQDDKPARLGWILLLPFGNK